MEKEKDMYIRYKLDNYGQVHLEQLIRIDKLDGNGPQENWEKIPLVGNGRTSSEFSPTRANGGVFLIEESIKKYDSHQKSTEVIITNVVSALSISKIQEVDKITKIELHDKRIFHVKIGQIEFIAYMRKALTSNAIIKIDINGNIQSMEDQYVEKQKEHQQEFCL
jgi:hypothetical protein